MLQPSSVHGTYGRAELSWRWRTWVSCPGIHLVSKLLLGQALGRIQGNRHIHPESISRSKICRQVCVLQCVLQAHVAICLRAG